MSIRLSGLVVALMFPLLIVGGCGVSSNISTSAVQADIAKIPVLDRSDVPRVFVAADNTPVFTSLSDRTSSKIDLYLTPSCPYCVSLYNGLINDNVIQSKKFENTAISVFLVPLREADFQIISNLTCLPGAQIPGTVTKYYAAILGISNASGTIAVDDLVELSRQTAMAAGATNTDLSVCDGRVANKAMVMKNWERARSIGRGGSWPLVVYKGKPTGASLPVEVIKLVLS